MYDKLNPTNITQIQVMLQDKKKQHEIAKALNVSKHSVFKVSKGEDYKRTDQIWINGASAKLKKDLKNIADNLGDNFSKFMIRECIKIAAKFPDKMKEKKPNY
jgi:DNA-binding XRE family transcriptional regulator